MEAPELFRRLGKDFSSLRSVVKKKQGRAWMTIDHSPIFNPYCIDSTSHYSLCSYILPWVPYFSYNRSFSVLQRSWRNRKRFHTRRGLHLCRPNWNLLQINLAERWLNWIRTTWQSSSKLHWSFGEIHFVPLSQDMKPLGQSPGGFSGENVKNHEIESKQRNWM